MECISCEGPAQMIAFLCQDPIRVPLYCYINFLLFFFEKLKLISYEKIYIRKMFPKFLLIIKIDSNPMVWFSQYLNCAPKREEEFFGPIISVFSLILTYITYFQSLNQIWEPRTQHHAHILKNDHYIRSVLFDPAYHLSSVCPAY